MLRKIILLTTLLIVGGCASTEAEQTKAAVALAKKRAAYINNNVPYEKVGQYLVMKARAHEKTVDITILYGGGGEVAPIQAVKVASNNYCSNVELSAFFNQGISYKIVIMDIRGRKLVEQLVNADYCNASV